MFDQPVLLLVFNRPAFTNKVIEILKEVQPSRLFIAADGPRDGNNQDEKMCQETRKVVIQNINWNCEVKTLFRENNLGCGLALSSAISWFFEHVEEGIILEDDVLPELSFFGFCQQLLERYRNDPEIFVIAGNNRMTDNQYSRIEGSYFFSAYSLIWGWATWRRAWNKYSFQLDPENLSPLKTLLRDYYKFKPSEVFYWVYIYERMCRMMVDTWDYQLTFSVWLNKGKCIIPRKNLVKNIGFGERATHTIGINRFDHVPSYEMENLVHPSSSEINTYANRLLSRLVYQIPSLDIKGYLQFVIKPLIKKMMQLEA